MTGQYDVKETDLLQFLSTGKNLGITGLLGVYNHIEENASNDIEVQNRKSINHYYITIEFAAFERLIQIFI